MTSHFAYTCWCSCQLVELHLSLPQAITDYTPRACDCAFCMARGIQYVSEPLGSAVLTCPRPLEVYQQGSMQAEFMACPQCDDVLAASMSIDNHKLASINATLLASQEPLKPAHPASPKKLNASDKLNRWKKIWMPLRINT